RCGAARGLRATADAGRILRPQVARTELTTSERPATYIGYKSDGRVKVYRYVVVLEENSGVGVNFGQVETTILARPGTRPTSRTQGLSSRLPANGHLRIPMADSTWLVVPQWFEGAARTL